MKKKKDSDTDPRASGEEVKRNCVWIYRFRGNYRAEVYYENAVYLLHVKGSALRFEASYPSLAHAVAAAYECATHARRATETHDPVGEPHAR